MRISPLLFDHLFEKCALTQNTRERVRTTAYTCKPLNELVQSLLLLCYSIALLNVARSGVNLRPAFYRQSFIVSLM
jgi:hypothetical protein